MATTDITGSSASAINQRMNQIRTLVQRYHADPEYRRQVEADPVAAFLEQGMELPSNIAVRVLANTDDTRYIIMPPDPNMGLDDELLSSVAGGAVTTAATAPCAYSQVVTFNTTSCPNTATTIGTQGPK